MMMRKRKRSTREMILKTMTFMFMVNVLTINRTAWHLPQVKLTKDCRLQERLIRKVVSMPTAVVAPAFDLEKFREGTKKALEGPFLHFFLRDPQNEGAYVAEVLDLLSRNFKTAHVGRCHGPQAKSSCRQTTSSQRARQRNI